MRSKGSLIFSFVLVLLGSALVLPAQTLSDAHEHTMPQTGQVTVPAEDGLTFQMKLNDQGPFATVFDTGAVNVISSSLAKRLGLKPDEQSLGFGAIGGGTKAHTAHVGTLSIGDLNVHNQTFFVIDIPAGAGVPQLLVGWELLQSFAVRIDFIRNELTFIDLDKFTYSGNGAAVRLVLNKHGNGIYFDARVDGTKGRFQLDTGNQTGFFLNSAFVDKHHLQQKLHATLRGYNGKGLGGDAPEAWFTRLQTLQLGSVMVRNPVVRLLTAKDNYLQTLAGNVGQSILRRFTVTIDCRHRVMYLEKVPDWDRREPFNRTGLLYDSQEDGDIVKTVFAGSAAEAAGLKPGDLITTINGAKPADDPQDPAFLASTGTIVHLTVQRNGVEQNIDLRLRDVL